MCGSRGKPLPTPQLRVLRCASRLVAHESFSFQSITFLWCHRQSAWPLVLRSRRRTLEQLTLGSVRSFSTICNVNVPMTHATSPPHPLTPHSPYSKLLGPSFCGYCTRPRRTCTSLPNPMQDARRPHAVPYARCLETKAAARTALIEYVLFLQISAIPLAHHTPAVHSLLQRRTALVAPSLERSWPFSTLKLATIVGAEVEA